MSKEDQSYQCNCKTGIRSLAVLTQNLSQSCPELVAFAKQTDWQIHSTLEALELTIGTEEAPTRSLSELINFFRGILDEARLKSLRGVWLDRGQPVEDQLVKLIHAGPLLDMAPNDSSRLLDILHQKRIETWFQPIYSIDGGTPWGYECLLRGYSQDDEIIPPAELFQWARQENLISMLDRISRETHLLNAGKQLPDVESVYILVNFTPTSIYRPEFCLKSTSAAANQA